MNTLEIIFWLSCALVGYTFLGYALLLALFALVRRPARRVEPVPLSVSVIVAVRDEAKNLERRLTELCRMVQRGGRPGEIIVVSDGSTDGSVEIAGRFASRGVRVIALAENQGKAVALSRGAAAARHELLVFADTRQHWADDALERLTENFADDAVGAVSGDLMLEAAPGVMAGVGLYWRFEKWLRRTESRVASQVGVTGAISAVRRELFPAEIPAGTLLDDVYWPLCVAMAGRRVVHDERAKAFDRLPDNPGDEFRRKVRTLAGGFQLLRLLPAALLPWRNPIWWQWLSHKLLRLVMPWALLAMLVTSALLFDEPFYRAAFTTQVAAYGLAVLGLIPAVGRQVRPLGAAASFLVLNAAGWLAFWVWAGGRSQRTWRKVDYGAPAAG